MEDKPMYYKDLAKIFGKHERTIQREIYKVKKKEPNNPILNNYMGDSWFCWSSDMTEVISLCSKLKSEKTEEVNTTT